MSEHGNFKSKLFGGFDRRDVSDYITYLARERNELKAKVERLEKENAELKARASEAMTAAEDEKRRADEFVVSAREEASAELSALCEKYGEVRSDMDVTSSHVRCELVRLADSLSLLSDVFGKAGERFSELKDTVKTEAEAAPEETEE